MAISVPPHISAHKITTLLAQDMEDVQRDVLSQAEARAEKAESEAAAEKEQRKRIMEAAANGALPLTALTPGRDIAID